MASLNWPDEAAGPIDGGDARLVQPGSNVCLGFHGDPLRAGHLDIGNLRLSTRPHLMIGPPPVLDQVVAT